MTTNLVISQPIAKGFGIIRNLNGSLCIYEILIMPWKVWLLKHGNISSKSSFISSTVHFVSAGYRKYTSCYIHLVSSWNLFSSSTRTWFDFKYLVWRYLLPLELNLWLVFVSLQNNKNLHYRYQDHHTLSFLIRSIFI